MDEHTGHEPWRIERHMGVAPYPHMATDLGLAAEDGEAVTEPDESRLSGTAALEATAPPR